MNSLHYYFFFVSSFIVIIVLSVLPLSTIEYRPTGLTDLQVRLLAMCCWVITWMDDHLWAGKPPQYVTRRLGQLSLPSLWGR